MDEDEQELDGLLIWLVKSKFFRKFDDEYILEVLFPKSDLVLNLMLFSF